MGTETQWTAWRSKAALPQPTPNSEASRLHRFPQTAVLRETGMVGVCAPCVWKWAECICRTLICCASMKSADDEEALARVFSMYCSFGKGSVVPGRVACMEGSAFVKLVVEAGLVEPPLDRPAIDLIFRRTCLRGQRRMSFSQFRLLAIPLLAQERWPHLDLVEAVRAASTAIQHAHAPSLNASGPVNMPDVIARLTNVGAFTGGCLAFEAGGFCRGPPNGRSCTAPFRHPLTAFSAPQAATAQHTRLWPSTRTRGRTREGRAAQKEFPMEVRRSRQRRSAQAAAACRRRGRRVPWSAT